MLDDETIANQQSLLETYRRNLRHLLNQVAQYGGASTAPLSVINSLYETHKNIQHIKGTLRSNGISVDDQPYEDIPLHVFSAEVVPLSKELGSGISIQGSADTLSIVAGSAPHKQEVTETRVYGCLGIPFFSIAFSRTVITLSFLLGLTFVYINSPSGSIPVENIPPIYPIPPAPPVPVTVILANIVYYYIVVPLFLTEIAIIIIYIAKTTFSAIGGLMRSRDVEYVRKTPLTSYLVSLLKLIPMIFPPVFLAFFFEAYLAALLVVWLELLIVLIVRLVFGFRISGHNLKRAPTRDQVLLSQLALLQILLPILLIPGVIFSALANLVAWCVFAILGWTLVVLIVLEWSLPQSRHSRLIQ